MTILFEIKLFYLKCVAYLSFVPILKPFWRRLVKLFEIALLLEGERTVSNNFTKRRQKSFKIGSSNKHATHLR